MKSSILLFLFLLLAVFLGNAQEFTLTEKYTFVNQRTWGPEEEDRSLVDLVASEDSSTIVATLGITSMELLEDVRITVLPNPGLEAVKEVVKVTFEYIACCANTETYYFLVDHDNQYTALPKIDNLYCDTAESDEHYVFPSQAFGKEGIIVRAELRYSATNGSIKNIHVLQSHVWNDDDFEYQDAITAIEP
ncbi:hypothetical protein [Maribacter sp. 2-571]|uniref:hypothetical protein n=1 Tax=Maribacter sp. 2-571 TaxID=3417569 RepID=UPI003D3380AD